ncbi:MAG: hypothetical protein MK212_06180 [Saprospiraceae bacterium]|nr:hypothetical protein [Saprospiraceae bacterium]
MDTINLSEYYKNFSKKCDCYNSIIISGLNIDKIIDYGGIYKHKIIIKDSIFNRIYLEACDFYEGLIIRNCKINNGFDFSCSGHNHKPIEFTNLEVNGFFETFDVFFSNIIKIEDCQFKGGHNIDVFINYPSGVSDPKFRQIKL